MKIRRPVVKQKSKTAPVDAVRDRMVGLVKNETGRLMMAVDDAKRQASSEQLDVIARILASTYTLIDIAREGRVTAIAQR